MTQTPARSVGVGLLFLTMLGAGATQTRAKGWLRGVAFAAQDRSAPAVGVPVTVVGYGTIRTGRDGSFQFALPGGYHWLRLPHGKKTVHVWVMVYDGEATEVLLTLAPGKPAQIDAEVPRGARAIPRTAGKKGAKVIVRGRVHHATLKTPIQGARVYARGSRSEGRSDARGWFTISLVPGTHDLTIIHAKYGTSRVRKLKVTRDKKGERRAIVVVKMAPRSATLPDLVVTAPKIVGNTASLMDLRRSSNAVTDVIGAEQMAKQGDSDAAGALRRVTGITVVGGRFVYVRGLGERYSSTLLNGSTLPSPEPEKRVVPLDMFPTALLQKVVIQKTYSVNLPGEFGGGAVQLYTRGFPSKFTASLCLSLGWVVGTSFTKVLRYTGGVTDWLGIDDGTRRMPGAVRAASDRTKLVQRNALRPDVGFSAEELERFGEMMPNIWNLRKRVALPNLGLKATLGSSFKLFGKKAGFLVAFVYDNKWDATNIRQTYTKVSDQGLEATHSYKMEDLENKITLAGILTLGVDLSKNHKIRLTSLVDRITDYEARRYEGYNSDLDDNIRVSRLRWVERMLMVHQLRGTHRFGQLRKRVDLDIGWRYTFSMAARDEPDRRETRFDQEASLPDRWLLSDRPEGNERFFSELLDLNHDLGVDLTASFKPWRGLTMKVKAGFNLVLKEREVDTRRYKYLMKGPQASDTDILALDPESIFSPQHIGPDGFVYTEVTRNTDNYSANQQIWGFYATTLIPLPRRIEVIAGLRVEGSVQFVRTFQLFSATTELIDARLRTTDVLPVFGVNYKPTKKTVLRALYARTVSRPEFRELSPAIQNEVTGGRQIEGNPDLERAVLDNVDLRFEWYPKRGETISVALFYKHFDSPIEMTVEASAQHTVKPNNAQGAHNLGAEITVRKKLGFVHSKIKDVFVAGNVAAIWSQIVLPEEGIQTSSRRPLQGQSPFVINLQLGYDNADLGTTVTVLYNVIGKRISEVGALGAPDIWEQPFHRLDLVYRQKLPRGFSITLKAKNILDLPVRFTQAQVRTETYRRGRVFTISATKRW